jgi:putative transposase
MRFDPEKHHRRSIRLRGYDYAQAGAYFVTVVTQERACCFGEVVEGRMELNDAGRMIWSEWEALSRRFPAVELDEFIVMPNHVHGIVWIVGASLVDAQDRATTRVAPTGSAAVEESEGATTRVAPTLGDVVGAFKSITTNAYITGVKAGNWEPFPGRLWHRNYYEHIIRNDESLNRIRRYIVDNPAQWANDDENPEKKA